MNKSTVTALTLMMGASSLSLAATESAAATPAAPGAKAPAFNFCEWAPNALKIFNARRDNAENPWIQEVSAKLRAQYQMGFVDPAGGTDRVKGARDGHGRRYNDEWRRVRFGLQAKVLNHFTLYTNWNVGGFENRSKYSGGRWHDDTRNTTLEEAYVQGTFKPVTFTIGKHKPAFIGEYRDSSAKIITIERSAIVNQLTPEKLYGISFKNADKKAELGWEAGAWLNGLHNDESAWASPSIHKDTNMMLGGSLSYATGEKSRLYLDYMHNFDDGDKIPPGRTNGGPAARDTIALTWEAKRDEFSFMAEAMAGLNLIGNANAENICGLVLMPSYRFTPHVEGVFRYQLASGSNAVKHDSRYYTTNSTYGNNCDLMHGLYFGVNYYVCPKNPDTMRIMAGVEYLNSHGKGADGKKGFTGWSYTTAVRCNF